MGYIVLHMMGATHMHKFFINKLEMDNCHHDLLTLRIEEVTWYGFEVKCIEVLDDELQRIDIYPY